MRRFSKNIPIFKEPALVFLLYLLVTVVVCFPFVIHFSSRVWGYVGDNWGSIWQAWWEKVAFLNRWDYHHSPLVGFPWGTTVSFGGVKEWLWWGWLKFLAIPLGEVVAFNLISLLGFPLAGTSAYLLAKAILARAFPRQRNLEYPAFLAGVVFSFSPYHFWQSYTHISLGQIQYLPLYFLAMLAFWQTPTWRRGILWGVSFGALVYSSFYYSYFVGVVSLPLLVFLLWRWRGHLRQKPFWQGLFGAGLVAGVSLLPICLSLFRGQVGGASGDILHRDIQDLLSLSVRPWDFLIPAPDHFLFAPYVPRLYQAIRSLSMDFKTISAYLPERALFSGWFASLLAGGGLILGWRKKATRQQALFWAILAGSAFLLGLPPFIYLKTKKILFPSYFLYQLLPMFRVYTRVGALVQLAVALLAGIGSSFLLSRLRGKRQALVFAFFLAIILFEYQGNPKKTSTDVSSLEKVNPAYQWLIDEGEEGAIIEYPQEYDTQEALFFQRWHQRPIFNMLGTPRQYSLWKRFSRLTDPQVPAMLASLGIKYAVWHHTDTLYPRGNPIDEPRYRKFSLPPLRRDTAELKLVYRGPDAYIYEITSEPSFSSPEELLEFCLSEENQGRGD